MSEDEDMWIHCGFQTLVELDDIHYFTDTSWIYILLYN